LFARPASPILLDGNARKAIAEHIVEKSKRAASRNGGG
jgi:hypothetical protein